MQRSRKSAKITNDHEIHVYSFEYELELSEFSAKQKIVTLGQISVKGINLTKQANHIKPSNVENYSKDIRLFFRFLCSFTFFSNLLLAMI